MINVLVIVLYLFFLTFVLAYSLAQLNLTILYLKAEKKKPAEKPELQDWPSVLIQLPVYNEKYVVGRLIDSVLTIDYPKDKLHIQILDDSDDETTQIIEEKLKVLGKKAAHISLIRRDKRVDFKAGALQYGLKLNKAPYVAIFDADFTPATNFLKRTVPYFNKPKVGVVQSRWEHLNYNYSILTRLQAYVLNAHFTIDQKGRNAGGHFINFNGTAGIWRRETIDDSGGWQGDTLTEDLDLSYRAQLKKWEFVYLEDLESPAELPAEMNALKSQQFRWAKGAAECTMKNLGNVLKADHLKLGTKVNAVFHLLNSFNWVSLLCSSLLLLPFTSVVEKHTSYQPYLAFMSVYYISFVLLFTYYAVANSQVNFKKPKDYLLFILSYPIFISLMLGLSVYNAVGVIEGYLGIRSSFVRTPKFNITSNSDVIKERSYVSFKFNFITLLELVFLLYCVYTAYRLYLQSQWGALPFAVMMIGGVFGVLFMSTFHFYRAGRKQ